MSEVSEDFWKKLEDDLNKWLKTFAQRYGLTYRNPYQSVEGFPYDGFKSDGMLTDGRSLLVIEIEATQAHPDTNVAKYWLLQSRYKKFEKIVLLHIYTPKFDSYGWRKELARFCAEKMSNEGVPIEYIVLDCREKKPNEYVAVLGDVKRRIEEKAREVFNLH